jgi:hypothetical protein
MAFRLPTFNITCNVWHAGPVVPPVGPPDIAGLQCQLAWDAAGGSVFLIGAAPRHFMLLRVPPRTDLRGQESSTFQDVVEVPAASGRFYVCWRVDDVGRGFVNEYRQGMILLGQTPTPMP